MQKEFVVFGLVIALIVVLFRFSSSTPDKAAFDGYNVVYNAGDTFELTIDRSLTEDSDLFNGKTSGSRNHPYSESWDDYGFDNCDDKQEDGKGGCLEEDDDLVWEKAGDDPNNDNWNDCGTDGLCDGDVGYQDPDDDGTEGNKTWDKGEKRDGNNEYDYGEKFYDIDNNREYTEDLLVFRWYKLEDIKDDYSGKKKYVGLDGYTLNTDVCSVKDFLKNECNDLDIFVECGKTHVMKDSDGMTTGWFEAPNCADFVSNEDGQRENWVLKYEGSDVGKLAINLKVLDLGSFHVNGDNQLLVHDEELNYKCTRIKQSGPKVKGVDVKHQFVAPKSIAGL